MRAVDLILKKRNNQELSKEEIEFLIQNYVHGQIPDYQLAAFCMAVYFQGMTPGETVDLTMAMANSGETIDLSPIPGLKIDKHSTGGVADTTTLVLTPLVAAAGVPVAKMSGRGLGHTGGTIDKLESIPGFQTGLTKGDFIKQVQEIGLAVVGQSGNLVPADKKLYALRDVTGTVDSIPLIASSIMSKKIAAGAQAILLDVKTGSGAFMRTQEDSFRLAEAMVAIGESVGRRTAAAITDMNEPLGSAIGNALEVEEAIRTLRGENRGILRDLCLTLGTYMLKLAGKIQNLEEGYQILTGLLDSGAALAKLAAMIEAQGGNPEVVNRLELLPQARYQLVVESWEEGYLQIEDAQALGLAAMILGAGRETKEAGIDLAVGLKIHARTGQKLRQGQPLLTLYYNDETRVAGAISAAKGGLKIYPTPVPARTLIYGMVTANGREEITLFKK